MMMRQKLKLCSVEWDESALVLFDGFGECFDELQQELPKYVVTALPLGSCRTKPVCDWVSDWFCVFQTVWRIPLSKQARKSAWNNRASVKEENESQFVYLSS